MENIQKILSKIHRLVELDNKQKEEARKRGELRFQTVPADMAW